MRSSDPIHDENGLLNVLLHNIHPKVGAIGAPPWAPLEWTVDRWILLRKVHPILHGRNKGEALVQSHPWHIPTFCVAFTKL